jgi:tetratricopeptide (TPR) repeat protein
MSLLPGLVWVAHGSVDWLWEFPALSGWAMVLAGAGAALAGPRGEAAPLPEAPRRRSSRGRAAIPLVAVLAAAALVVTPAMDWIAERDVAAAQAQWPTDRQAAFRRLDRAAGLDPSARPKLVEGLIAAQIGDGARARSAFMAAHDREPQDWFALLNLGLLASAAGDRAEARLRFVAALARDPREPVVQAALRQVGKAHPLTFKQVVELLRARTNRRFGPR